MEFRRTTPFGCVKTKIETTTEGRYYAFRIGNFIFSFLLRKHGNYLLKKKTYSSKAATWWEGRYYAFLWLDIFLSAELTMNNIFLFSDEKYYMSYIDVRYNFR